MRVESVRYERLVNLGNYENQRVGVTVILEPEDTPSEALRRAKAFVEKSLEPEPSEYEIQKARRIIENPDDYPPRQLRDAQELLKRAEEDIEVPF